MTAAERLASRLDELASSLHRAGVTDEAAARLLELSALATMKAVELELRAAEPEAPVHAAAERSAAAPPMRAAA